MERESISALRWNQRGLGALVYALGGLATGLMFRLVVDLEVERNFANFVRSGLHGVGLAMTLWALQRVSSVRSPIGAMLRRLPLALEVLARSSALGVAFVVVSVAL